MRSLVLLLSLSGCAVCADNALTATEKEEGFVLLFDGRSFHGWRSPQARGSNSAAWVIEDGALRSTSTPVREDLITARSYGNFELKFDWRISRDGNTGIKYRIQKAVFVESSNRDAISFEASVERAMKSPDAGRARLEAGVAGQEYTVAYEFQLIDDDTTISPMHKDQLTGALYSMIPPRQRATSTVGEWSHSRLLVQGDHFEHWVNDIKVLDGTLNSQQAREATSRRWADAPTVRETLLHAKPAGPISLQHHGTPVWFKNIRIRAL
jgi:hypothetical protein